MDLKEVYETNELFKHYADKYAITRKLTIEEALQHNIMRMYAIYLGEQVDEE